jgi:hypothetical protein
VKIFKISIFIIKDRKKYLMIALLIFLLLKNNRNFSMIRVLMIAAKEKFILLMHINGVVRLAINNMMSQKFG